MKFFVHVLLIGVLLSSCSSKFSKVMKSKDSEYKLKMAEQFYANKKYSYAQQLFDDLFPTMKGKEGYEDAFYKYAYCAYYQKDWLNAENLFKTYIETFPNSPRAEECEYMRAYTFYKQSPKVDLDQTNTTKAIALMQAFITTHPTSERSKEATEIIAKLRQKLELKEFKTAELYYNLGHFKSAATSFGTLIDNYPDSDKGDNYMLYKIKSSYKYAEMSFYDKQEERFEKVITACGEFKDRFPDSKLLAEVEEFKTHSTHNIKKIHNEQAQATTQR
ncbi:outer membrane protein assembly factor BamD [Danxiaibacter flavus]|uniref:Outer membrane protein assembly factor BamD n=1 Tax=Danxiaibacter flavus TaxID=3049108 RepID=A0ABV3ZII0_9BACT|nr:outer membrane protein assembly factor BamD [Chitinophagaceae bacterium DXS]